MLALLLLGTLALAAQNEHSQAKQFDELIEQALGPIGGAGPGVAVFIHQAGSEPYRKVQGMANLEYGIPLTEHSVFDLASLAKQFTGLAIARLELAGKLKLTDDVRKYLPEIHDFGATITLGQLLYHTSGLRDVGTLCRVGNFHGSLNGARALEVIARQRELNFAPATAHDYSNTGYVLLALMVERVTGQTFANWCADNIFAPLQMTETRVNDAPDNLIANRAVAYYGRDGKYSFDQNNGMSLIGSSAVFSSPSDMEKWMAFVAGDDPAVRRMMQPGTLADGTPVGYGYGLSIGQFAGRSFISHSGATPAGFRTLTAFLPESDTRLVILSSWGDLDPVQDLGLPIMDLLFGQGTNPKAVAEAPVAKFIEIIAEETLESYVGNYLFNGELPVSVSREGQVLSVSVADRPTVAMDTRSPTDFYSEAMNSLLTFEVENEQVSRVVIKQEGEYHGELKPVGSTKDEAEPTFALPTAAAGRFYSEELDLSLTLSLREGSLWLSSGRHGSHELLQRSGKSFVGMTDLFQGLTLNTDAAGKVASFTMSLGSRARNLHFARW